MYFHTFQNYQIHLLRFYLLPLGSFFTLSVLWAITIGVPLLCSATLYKDRMKSNTMISFFQTQNCDLAKRLNFVNTYCFFLFFFFVFFKISNTWDCLHMGNRRKVFCFKGRFMTLCVTCYSFCVNGLKSFLRAKRRIILGKQKYSFVRILIELPRCTTLCIKFINKTTNISYDSPSQRVHGIVICDT